MLKKSLYSFLLMLTLVVSGLKAASPPDEGMWLMMLVERLNYDEMKKMGCKLSAEEIYSVNNSSIKDAIVQLGGFCTAEVISDQGLLLTNHHCAYDAIQSHSSTENDYLTDGFWAKDQSAELPVPGLTVSFLVRMEDVTKRILDAAGSDADDNYDMKIAEEIGKIEDEAGAEGKYRAEVKDMFKGSEFYLFVYQSFRDIRLVGAPPSSIGKFGGDTDNWMWPRHTGDFSMLRIYAGSDNEPADFAAENRPYKPKHFLPISLKGVKEGDFSMIMGYPGNTDRWLTSAAIDQTYTDSNPTLIKLLNAKLKIMKSEMDKDDAVRIKLASDYASLANSYKYFLGQNLGLSRRGLTEEKQDFEAKFTKWVNADPKRKAEYGNVLKGIQDNYSNSKDVLKLGNYVNIAGFGTGLVVEGIQFFRLHRSMESSEDPSAWQGMIDMIKGGQDGFFKDYDWMTDKKVFAAMMRLMYNDLPASVHPSIFTSKEFLKAKAKGDNDRFDTYADFIYGKSFIVDRSRMDAFLAKPSKKALDADPGVKVVLSIIDLYRNKLQTGQALFGDMDETLMRKYTKGVREMNPEKDYYPDANFTMRLSYGKVIPYDPRDAVKYEVVTTTDGILQKETPGDEEFEVPTKLLDMIKKKDFGRYAQKDGRMPVCFLTDHDITGGNSGSPVINGDGQLIGIAFDGNWESMTSDLVFDDDMVRTISVDVRYVLWIIDKYAGAGHLLKEMKLVE